MLKHCKHETRVLLSVDQGAKFCKASIETTQLVFVSGKFNGFHRVVQPLLCYVVIV